jgi:Fic family protein
MSGGPKKGERQSKALDAELIVDEEQRARREARNGVLQFDHVAKLIDQALDPERPIRLRPSTLLALNRTALEGINIYAGNDRPGPVTIGGSRHIPPEAFRVPELVEELCEYVNANWDASSPLHLSAYVLWRLNWIHPFADGNGRTSRASSYLVLCARLGAKLPGTTTVPEQIAADKRPYYDALEHTDQSVSGEKFDLSRMDALLGDLLAVQLAGVLHLAAKPPR